MLTGEHQQLTHDHSWTQPPKDYLKTSLKKHLWDQNHHKFGAHQLSPTHDANPLKSTMISWLLLQPWQQWPSNPRGSPSDRKRGPQLHQGGKPQQRTGIFSCTKLHKFMKSHHYSHETPHQKRVKSHLQFELKILKDVQDTTTKLTDYHE